MPYLDGAGCAQDAQAHEATFFSFEKSGCASLARVHICSRNAGRNRWTLASRDPTLVDVPYWSHPLLGVILTPPCTGLAVSVLLTQNALVLAYAFPTYSAQHMLFRTKETQVNQTLLKDLTLAMQLTRQPSQCCKCIDQASISSADHHTKHARHIKKLSARHGGDIR